MQTILLVQENSADGDSIRRTLTDQGWHVNLAKNAGEALRSAAKHAPNLVLVDGTITEAPSLLKSFSLGNGGPGAVVILPHDSTDNSHPASPDVDGILQRPFTPEDLIELANRRLSAPRQSESTKSAVRGEVFNAQQIFGGILNELDEEEPETEQSKKPPAVKVPVSAKAEASATQKVASATSKIPASPKIEAPKPAGAADTPSAPTDDLEDRLNRAMSQALKVAEEVSSASFSVSEVDTFKTLDQEIDDQLAGVMSEVENPEAAVSSTPTSPKPPASAPSESESEETVDQASVADSAETVSVAPSSDVDRETAGTSPLYGTDTQDYGGIDSIDDSEVSEEYEAVGLASLLQKNKIAVISAAAAVLLAVILFFWFKGRNSEEISSVQAGTVQQQEFRAEYPPAEEDPALLADGAGDLGLADDVDESQDSASLGESAQDLPDTGTSDPLTGSTDPQAFDSPKKSSRPADKQSPPAMAKTTSAPQTERASVSQARTPQPTKPVAKDTSKTASASTRKRSSDDTSSLSRPTTQSSQQQPVQRPPTKPAPTTQSPTTSAPSQSGTANGTTSQPATGSPRTTSPRPQTKNPTDPRQQPPSSTSATNRTSSVATQPVKKSTQPIAAPTKKASPPPKKVAKRGDLVRPGAGVRSPVLVNLPTAPYPTIARKLKLEGSVRLSILVNELGRVLEVKVTKPPAQDRGFSDAAVKAVRGAKFKPATKDGVEVKIWHSITIRFEL